MFDLNVGTQNNCHVISTNETESWSWEEDVLLTPGQRTTCIWIILRCFDMTVNFQFSFSGHDKNKRSRYGYNVEHTSVAASARWALIYTWGGIKGMWSPTVFLVFHVRVTARNFFIFMTWQETRSQTPDGQAALGLNPELTIVLHIFRLYNSSEHSVLTICSVKMKKCIEQYRGVHCWVLWVCLLYTSPSPRDA